MNIVLFSHTFLPTIGGRELVVHHLANSLQVLGCNVRVFGPTGWIKNRSYKLNYEVRRYPRFIRVNSVKNKLVTDIQDQETYLKLWYDISRFGCDIIHAHTTYPGGYVSSLITRKKKNIPLIITPHGVDIHTIPRLGHGMRLNPVLRPKIDTALAKADYITSISAGMESSILDAGADINKLVRIPNGVDLDRFSRTNDFNIYQHFNINSKAKIIVTVGNYHPRKGHEVILKAMQKIILKDPLVHLVVVGKNQNKLDDLIQNLGISTNVTLAGSIPFSIDENKIIANGMVAEGSDILAALYQNSLAYISAGTEHGAEGLSLAVLEAMASGLPIVASRISGNLDIVKDGQNGFLVEPSDPMDLAEKIITLLADEKNRKELSLNSQKTTVEYGWIEIARKYIELYERALQLKSSCSNQ